MILFLLLVLLTIAVPTSNLQIETACEGASVRMKCNCIANYLLAVRFNKNSVKPKKEKYNFINGTLLLENASKLDEGIYGLYCHDGQTMPCKFNFQLDETCRETKAQEGSTITFNCKIPASNSNDTINWSKKMPGKQALPLGTNTNVTSEATMLFSGRLSIDYKYLTITNVHKTDKGRYFCLPRERTANNDYSILLDVETTATTPHQQPQQPTTTASSTSATAQLTSTSTPQPVSTYKETTSTTSMIIFTTAQPTATSTPQPVSTSKETTSTTSKMTFTTSQRTATSTTQPVSTSKETTSNTSMMTFTTTQRTATSTPQPVSTSEETTSTTSKMTFSLPTTTHSTPNAVNGSDVDVKARLTNGCCKISEGKFPTMLLFICVILLEQLCV